MDTFTEREITSSTENICFVNRENPHGNIIWYFVNLFCVKKIILRLIYIVSCEREISSEIQNCLSCETGTSRLESTDIGYVLKLRALEKFALS